MSDVTMSRIPVTIVTGFLGSGKTTVILNVIRQLQAENPDYRVALVKNEFGDVAIDSQLATASAISGVQELLNGCICCNLVGQVGTALTELAATAKPNRVLIETSGSAMPTTLALEVNRVARETGQFELDGVVSVIDVENWQGYEDTSYTVKIQARYVDMIIFNKWEDCSEDRLELCRDRVGDLELDIPCIRSDHGSVPLDLFFGLDAPMTRSLLSSHGSVDHDHASSHDHSTTDHNHDHQREVEVLSLEIPNDPQNPTASIQLDPLLGLLRTAPKDEVYRIKAVLTTSDLPPGSDFDGTEGTATPPHPQHRYILNWAFTRWTFTPHMPGPTDATTADALLRMTIILARGEALRWKKKLEMKAYLTTATPPEPLPTLKITKLA